MRNETLYYLGAGLDDKFLHLLPKYKKYELFDIKDDNDFKDKIKEKFGKYKNINYHIGYDTDKNVIELNGDVYISGYYPDWFRSYEFKGYVFFHRKTVLSTPINTKEIIVG